MAPKIYRDEAPTRSGELELPRDIIADTRAAEGAPMAESTSSHLNGSGKHILQDTEDHAFIRFARITAPHFLSAIGGVLAIFSALYVTGFLQPPATKSSVQELKTEVLDFIDKHDKLEAARGSERSARQEYIQRELVDLKNTVNSILQRMIDSEVRQARIEGILLKSQPLSFNPPLPAPDPYIIPKPKPEAPPLTAKGR